MYLSVSLIVMATLGASNAQNTYDSYTKAYWAANEVKRPMLVILNPGSEQESQPSSINIEELQQDENTRAALEDYVVAVIDTGTAHGKVVHGLFGSPQLPRVVVIDERQDKQVYQTSETITSEKLAGVLQQHKTNPVVRVSAKVIQPSTGSSSFDGSFNSFVNPPGNCPNCRRNQGYQPSF